MSWNAERSLEEVRMEFLVRWTENKIPVRALCREYGISPKTAYKWKKRKMSGDSLVYGPGTQAFVDGFGKGNKCYFIGTRGDAKGR